MQRPAPDERPNPNRPIEPGAAKGSARGWKGPVNDPPADQENVNRRDPSTTRTEGDPVDDPLNRWVGEGGSPAPRSDQKHPSTVRREGSESSEPGRERDRGDGAPRDRP